MAFSQRPGLALMVTPRSRSRSSQLTSNIANPWNKTYIPSPVQFYVTTHNNFMLIPLMRRTMQVRLLSTLRNLVYPTLQTLAKRCKTLQNFPEKDKTKIQTCKCLQCGSNIKRFISIVTMMHACSRQNYSEKFLLNQFDSMRFQKWMQSMAISGTRP